MFISPNIQKNITLMCCRCSFRGWEQREVQLIPVVLGDKYSPVSGLICYLLFSLCEDIHFFSANCRGLCGLSSLSSQPHLQVLCSLLVHMRPPLISLCPACTCSAVLHHHPKDFTGEKKANGEGYLHFSSASQWWGKAHRHAHVSPWRWTYCNITSSHCSTIKGRWHHLACLCVCVYVCRYLKF